MFDAVLKIGGSLSRGDGLADLCREVGRVGERFRLMVVPGGGRFADEVRDAYKKFSLGETPAHRMALLAMDQYAYVLNHLIPGSVLTRDLEVPPLKDPRGSVKILLPASSVDRTDALPHSWDVTSDAIAAWVARRVRCESLVLVKDVDGLISGGSSPELLSELSVSALMAHRGGIDGSLHRFLAGSSIETWVISGLYPKRLTELLETGHTVGTRIRRS
jgi:aspartokinase-like uncharacterized kinase